MKYLIPILLICLPLYVFAGDDDRIPIETNILKLPQGFQYNALSSEGYNSHCLFLNGRVKIFITTIEIELALADSHLFSSEFRKQTLLKLSAAYSF